MRPINLAYCYNCGDLLGPDIIKIQRYFHGNVITIYFCSDACHTVNVQQSVKRSEEARAKQPKKKNLLNAQAIY